MNPQSEEANETWKFVETTEEEKATIYRYLSKVYRGMRNGLLINSQVQRSYCTPFYLTNKYLYNSWLFYQHLSRTLGWVIILISTVLSQLGVIRPSDSNPNLPKPPSLEWLGALPKPP